jgi:hypothetical protein
MIAGNPEGVKYHNRNKTAEAQRRKEFIFTIFSPHLPDTSVKLVKAEYLRQRTLKPVSLLLFMLLFPLLKFWFHPLSELFCALLL